ncbi:MAG TPA: FAD-binding oxidoreductase [Polyangiaceae bacterium]
MPKITFRGALYEGSESETVLDALLRQGADAPHSCKKGVCHACLMRCTNARPPSLAQDGLRPTQREQGYFLACRAPATQDMVLAEPRDAGLSVRAELRSKKVYAAGVCRLRFAPPAAFHYHAGQFVNLRRPDGLMRSYSLASVPQTDEHLEVHVRRMKNGKMSNWLFDELEVGQSIELCGPTGSCFYLPGREAGDLLLVGTGTGLAPLVGIARDALLWGHRGRVHLYHGSDTVAGFYLEADLHRLAERFRNFRYKPCLRGSEAWGGAAPGFANDVAFSEHPTLAGWRVFLCGAPTMVTAAKKTAYLCGASLADIHSDPFELAELRRTAR